MPFIVTCKGAFSATVVDMPLNVIVCCDITAFPEALRLMDPDDPAAIIAGDGETVRPGGMAAGVTVTEPLNPP